MANEYFRDALDRALESFRSNCNADAVIGMRVNTFTILQLGNAFVTVTGTSVKLERIESDTTPEISKNDSLQAYKKYPAVSYYDTLPFSVCSMVNSDGMYALKLVNYEKEMITALNVDITAHTVFGDELAFKDINFTESNEQDDYYLTEWVKLPGDENS